MAAGDALMNARSKGKPKKFIQSAIKRPGSLHTALGVPQGEKIPEGKIAAAAQKGGNLGRKARFAQTLAKVRS
jgi:hypothetical protein